ncbi:MAG: HDOD domain-containing protein [Polyangiaceae bacterium]
MPPDEIPPDLESRVQSVLGQSTKYDAPVLPEVAKNVLEVTRDERCEPRSLADLLKRDAAMAAGVLRAANSPAYAPRAPIVSLSHAISRLGLDAIRKIAVLVACNERVFAATGREALARSLYFHSTLTAFVAQEVARKLKAGVEDAFIGGLLHDIGQAVALKAIARVEATGRRFTDAEAQAMALALHQPLGAQALASWGLPPRTLVVVGHHHTPAMAPEHRELVTVVSIADDLAYAFAEGKDVDLASFAARQVTVNLYDEDLLELIARRDELMAWARGIT